MPQVVSIDDIQVGTILNEDVINPQGLVLIKKGIELTEKHIKVLRRWGISSVSLVDALDSVDNSRPSADVIKEKLAEVTTKLDSRFVDCDNSEIMMHIKRCVYDYQVEQIKKKFGE
ncbi:hypothetical protein ACFL3D_03895 [Candidatus Omnitrophota bacterium]